MLFVATFDGFFYFTFIFFYSKGLFEHLDLIIVIMLMELLLHFNNLDSNKWMIRLLLHLLFIKVWFLHLELIALFRNLRIIWLKKFNSNARFIRLLWRRILRMKMYSLLVLFILIEMSYLNKDSKTESFYWRIILIVMIYRRLTVR